MKDAITKSETTTLAGFPPSQRSSAFVVASDLEKGFGSKENVYTVTKEIAAPPAVGPYDSVQIPPKRQVKAVRNVRHTLLNVYRRLFSLVFLGNMIAFIYFVVQWWRTAPPAGKHSSVSSRIPLSALSTAASANILVAILIRQDYIVNLLFKSLWWLPHSWPLRIRRMAAKVYENGGVHSGAAVAGTVWFILLTVCLNVDFIQQGWKSDGGWIAVLVLTYVLVIMLISIVLIAYPRFRFMSHNTFEYSHRFAGWSAIAIFWAELVLLGRQTAASTGEQLGHVLIRQPTFWILLVISFHIILPWLRLRKWTFTPEQLSNHALRLRFSKDIPPLSGLAIAEHPLGEWHPFATFPNWDSHVDASGHVNTDIDQEERGLPIIRSGRTNRAGGVGGSMIISDAGDWTKRTILEPRTQYWVKGVPKTGVLSMAFLFSRVVVVTTGLGDRPVSQFPARAEPQEHRLPGLVVDASAASDVWRRHPQLGPRRRQGRAHHRHPRLGPARHGLADLQPIRRAARRGRLRHQQPEADAQARLRHGEQRHSRLWSGVGLVSGPHRTDCRGRTVYERV